MRCMPYCRFCECVCVCVCARASVCVSLCVCVCVCERCSLTQLKCSSSKGHSRPWPLCLERQLREQQHPLLIFVRLVWLHWETSSDCPKRKCNSVFLNSYTACLLLDLKHDRPEFSKTVQVYYKNNTHNLETNRCPFKQLLGTLVFLETSSGNQSNRIENKSFRHLPVVDKAGVWQKNKDPQSPTNPIAETIQPLPFDVTNPLAHDPLNFAHTQPLIRGRVGQGGGAYTYGDKTLRRVNATRLD